ncbi:MAG: RDD family protein [Candidatus Nanopelagicales bacterium]|jgi:uncharacterized RDD family membrane protein YckC|nr:RDD family protein [Candidatus Nanopelagicales bacterium]
MADLVTGDAVTLELRVAGLPSRTLALAVDLVVQLSLLALGLVLVAWVFSAGGSPGAQAAVTLLTVVGVLVGWPTLLETTTRGRSLGKVLMGLRVVRDDGGPVRMRHALVRALAMVFLDLWTTSGIVGGLSALISTRAKRMGDHLAGTIVVGERLPRGTAPPSQVQVLMPPPLAGWAAGLDLVGVPDGLALNVRTFLHRAPSLDPAAREATARQLATELAGHVRTPAPPGTPAEAYLAAVLAERSRRAHAGGAGGGWAVPGTPSGPGPAPVPPGVSASGPAAATPPPPPTGTPPTSGAPGFTLPQ